MTPRCGFSGRGVACGMLLGTSKVGSKISPSSVSRVYCVFKHLDWGFYPRSIQYVICNPPPAPLLRYKVFFFTLCGLWCPVNLLQVMCRIVLYRTVPYRYVSMVFKPRNSGLLVTRYHSSGNQHLPSTRSKKKKNQRINHHLNQLTPKTINRRH